MPDAAATPDSGHPASAGVAGIVPLMSQDFTAGTVTSLRHALQAQVTAAGLTGDVGYDFVLAVHELVTNAVRHGGGHGHLDLRRHDDVLICEITDQGATGGSLPVRLSATDIAGGRGLWLAHQLTEGLILTQRASGVTATVTACLDRADRNADPTPRSSGHGEPGRAEDAQG
ncbi:ATP-binding protein [Micromonospora sp. R77]|uniref:ATP-binding protein n=1 Tax=Micromonospora sp. R77 TaxID=2925836 RepID=UPI001F62435C|nr:ATP-binding protein [Micromonospora sp. R77]MCI4063961.1 ATP-binding protein [Micromonospora sp. R77]